mgnify:FL=1
MLQSPLEFTIWIDACPTDGNLLLSGGVDRIIRIFDLREAKVCATFEDIHEGNKTSSIVLYYDF